MSTVNNTPAEGAHPINSDRPLRIALAGNPNSGKTALFNALTGLRYKVANYPGVTVERKEGRLELDEKLHVVAIDIPGAYSLESTAIDEQIATKALFGEINGEPAPDIILAVVDSTTVERNLFFASQLLDLEIPMVIALSMSDLSSKHGVTVHSELLSKELGVPVIAISARSGQGLASLKQELANICRSPRKPQPLQWLKSDSLLSASVTRLSVAIQTHEPTHTHATLHALALLGEARSSHNSEVLAAMHKERSLLLEADRDPFSAEATARYLWISEVVSRTVSRESSASVRQQQKIDSWLTHRFWGVIIFLGVMAFIFQSIFFWATVPMDWIDQGVSGFGSWIEHLLPPGELRSLLVDGIIAGVGSVLIFIPQISILFFFIGLLEDSGYLARAAFVTDRIMRKFGLQGRAFVPLLSSFACAIPGIMSTRTIPTFTDRLTTIMIAPLMSCSARLPVYSLLIAAFVPAGVVLGIFSLQGMVMLSMYLLGIIGALAIAWALKLSLFRGKTSPFVMEMPHLRIPSFTLVVRNVLDRVLLFVRNAGTVILACSVILWFLATHPGPDVQSSYAGQLGQLIEPVLRPLGLGWEVGVGIIASFAAREVFVSSLATVYSLQASDDNTGSLLELLREQHSTGRFSLASAVALMIFYVYACQCMSTLAVVRRETGSWRWTAFMFTYMTLVAYAAAFFFYRLGLYLHWV